MIGRKFQYAAFVALIIFSVSSWADEGLFELAYLSSTENIKKAANIVDTTSPVDKKQIFTELAALPGQTVKITEKGEIVAMDSEEAACVYLQTSGLVWETKSNNKLRNKESTYTWKDNQIEAGFFDPQGECTGDIRCDTASYIKAINEQKLCNFSDWRLPTKEELSSLVNYSTKSSVPAINKGYFPNTQPSWYWTSTTNANSPDHAWYVLFRNSGASLNDLKNRPKHIRLVRGKNES